MEDEVNLVLYFSLFRHTCAVHTVLPPNLQEVEHLGAPEREDCGQHELWSVPVGAGCDLSGFQC